MAQISLFFKISQWNLVGTLAMGLIAHILMYDRHVMLSLNYDRKCAKKWTNECTNCEVPGRDGQNSFIPWYLAPCPKHFLVYEIFRWPLTWPRYRSKVRKRLNPYSSLGFLDKITKLIIEVLYSEALRMVVADKRFDLFSLGHVTLNLSVRSL